MSFWEFDLIRFCGREILFTRFEAFGLTDFKDVAFEYFGVLPNFGAQGAKRIESSSVSPVLSLHPPVIRGFWYVNC